MLQIIAEDTYEPTFVTTATVTINIKDDNDNSPTFPNATYALEVPEHSPDGTTLATITVRLFLSQKSIMQCIHKYCRMQF